MEKKVEEKKAYLKPEVRRIELSLSEVTLAVSCYTVTNPALSGDCGSIGGTSCLV